MGVRIIVFSILLFMGASANRLLDMFPNVSTTTFTVNDQQRLSPLAVLRAEASGGDGPELEIFPEDPGWGSKVEDFMIAVEAATQIEESLMEVRHLSWTAGRTFQAKHAVLLAFADDACSSSKIASCRLTRAMLAASRHTMDAHFILVTDGFMLDEETREVVEGVLETAAWRAFTSIELPEFEGFSSAHDGNHSCEKSTLSEENCDEGFRKNGAGDDIPRDIFVAYERMKRSSSVATSRGALEEMDNFPESSTHTVPVSGPRSRSWGDHKVPDAEGNNLHLSARQPPSSCEKSVGLLMTASPSHLIANRRQNRDHNNGGPSAGDAINEQEESGSRPCVGSLPNRPPVPLRPHSTRISDVAPFPLLVFDTETYFALGELNEKFAFQGGVAEWMDRAKLNNGGQVVDRSGIDGDGCRNPCCPCVRTWEKEAASPDCEKPAEVTCSAFTGVQHVTEREWSSLFVGSWIDYNLRMEDTIEPRCSNASESTLEARSSRVDPINCYGLQGATDELILRRGESNSPETNPVEYENRHTREEAIIDQRNRVPAARLETLVQADADLFFLPLLLSQESSENCSVGLRISFHSEWMRRGPDKLLMNGALPRRNEFPVAMVVVMHDEISLLRPALEAVAVVVEYILVVVNRISWNGDVKDVSTTLKLLGDMMEDSTSPTYGKLRVDVGSWATEVEQRDYGNSIIRQHPRHFVRVVVMDPNEFWHPVELARALVVAARNPQAKIARAESDTYWVGLRSMAYPSEMLNAVWLADPRSCSWDEYRTIECEVQGGEEHLASLFMKRDVGIVRQLSYLEQRHDSEKLELRPVAGNLAVVDLGDSIEAPVPSWVTGRTDAFGYVLVGAQAVLSKGKHVHTNWSDMAEEMSRVQGAMVVRRPDLTKAPGSLAPLTSLDYVKKLQIYFAIFKRSLFPMRMMMDGYRLTDVYQYRRFVNAVANGDSEAGRYLSSYYADVEVPKRANDGYENPPTVVGMADVFINRLGHVWNSQDYTVLKSCNAQFAAPRARITLPGGVKSYDKVFVMTQCHGDEYFHFLVEAMPRVTLMLDILQENLDIKIAVNAPGPSYEFHKAYMYEILELLGLGKDRVIFIGEEIHANLAVLPSSTRCYMPDTQTINMLRHALLKGLHRRSGGVPRPPRPVIVLIVRLSGRALKNNDEVREALKQEFPSAEVVEFFGTGPIGSQLKLFATASLIVGPHGAGLSNMMVSPLHTPVLEIGAVDCPSSYMNLALKLQHIYARHPGNDDWTTPCGTKYEPNIGEILLLVRDLLEAQRRADAADPPRGVVARL